MTRQGFYFSFDALVALTLVALSFFIIAEANPDAERSFDTQLSESLRGDAAGESALQVAMRQSLGEALNDSERERYLDETVLVREDLDRSVMEAIAVLWASNQTAAARDLSRTYFGEVVPRGYEYRLSIRNEGTTAVYNSSRLGNATFVATASRLVSGVSRNRPTRGYIARATLQEATERETENVFYGGYIGDGNITSNVTLPDLDTVLNVTFEGSFSGPFDLYFNGVHAGHFTPETGNLSADVFQVCTAATNASVCEALTAEDNEVGIEFDGGNRSIGGATLRIVHNRTTQLEPSAGPTRIERKRIHGINGVINLFSSFYVPGDLREISARLHFDADNVTVFMSVGNATVYREEADGETTVTMDNTTIATALTGSGMGFDSLDRRTIPFRIGVTRRSLQQGEAGPIDAVATTDLSGSMDSQCTAGGGAQCKIRRAKNATEHFIDVLMGTPDARLGLTGFNDFIKSYHQLSRDNESLYDQVETYDGNGGTCVGCGIIRSTNTLIMRYEERPLLRRGGDWRYRLGPADNTSWADPSFNASDWDEAGAPLGSGGEAVSQIGDADIYRFRRTFQFERDDYYQPYIYLRHTGNATVYLNGEPLHRGRFDGTGRYWDSYRAAWVEKTGLWHRSSQRSLTSTDAWHFGQEEVARYSTGVRETGNLTTPVLDLSNVSDPEIRYSDWLELEKNKDHAYVQVDNGTGWTTLRDYTAASSGWRSETIDLSPYASDTVRVRFRFAAADAKGKSDEYEGWYVDNVSVAGFDSDVINRSLFQEGTNVLAVRMNGTEEPTRTATVNRSDLSTGTFDNTTASGGDVVLDGATTGRYTTAPIDAGDVTNWTVNVTGAAVPAGTNLSFRYGTNASGTWAYADTPAEVTNGRYLRVRVTFRSNETGRTPELRWIEVGHRRSGTGFDAAVTADRRRTPSIVVLSDGKSNQETAMDDVPDHDGDGDVDASDHSIEAACRANRKYRATVYAVAFGENADREELRLVAQCGGGQFYNATIESLTEVYDTIAQDIIQASFERQQIRVTGGELDHTLFPDSHITLNYTPPEREAGTFRLTQRSDRFGGDVSSPKNGSFTVPPDVTVTDAKVTSYSGNFWTDRLRVFNGSAWPHVYRLWRYRAPYPELGDPYTVNIPTDRVTTGVNNVSIDTGASRTDTGGGSPDDRVIYTLAVTGTVPYGRAFGKAEGGTYTFQTVAGPTTLEVGNASDPWNASNDAVDNATARLLDRLDVDGDGVVDFQLDAEDISIGSADTGGIEWLWGPATVSLEVWKDE